MGLCYSPDLLPISYDNYEESEKLLYDVFKNELLNKIYLNGKSVKFKTYPPEGKEKEIAFYHITETDYSGETENRYLDVNRGSRIKLIKPIIENANKCPSCKDDDCSSILIWEKPYKKTYRYHLFLQDMDYLVVLEERVNYYLLITAFYVYHESVDKYLMDYETYKIDEIS